MVDMWIVEGAVLESGEILLECQELTLVAAIARDDRCDGLAGFGWF